MKDYQLLNTEIEKYNSFVFATHTNSPFTSILEVLEDRPRAVRVKHEHNNMPVWIPKAALKSCGLPSPAFTLKTWFRKKLIREQNNYPFAALEIVC